MAERGSPTVRRRRLGYELRLLREQAGKTLVKVAADMSWSDSKVSRIENGRSAAPWGDISDLLDYYGITDRAVRDPLIALARDARRKDWWHSYLDVLKRPYATYIGLEAAAEWARIFEPLTIPGQLQTEAYIRAITATNTRPLSDTEIDRLTQVRLRRQEVIEGDDPLRLHVILDEAALHREVGGPQVMREQLDHFIAAAARPHIRLQVLAFSQGAHVAMPGSFTVFTFPADADPDVAFIETVGTSLFLERRAAAAARDAFDELSAQALSPAATVELLTRISAIYARRFTTPAPDEQ